MKVLSRLVILSILASASAAHAVALGDTVSCASTTLVCSRSSNTVSAATEFTLDYAGLGVFYADFANGALTLTSSAIPFSTTGVSGLTLTFSDATHPFTQASLTSTSGVSGVGASDVTLNGGMLKLDLSDATFGIASRIVVAVPTASAVPEPATWATMIGGFAMIGFALRWAGRRSAMAFGRG